MIMTFTVIIPTDNRIHFLEKAIESVHRPTFQDFDKTKVIHHTSSKGGNAARNAGILHSQGELITFLDDDDTWLPEKLDFHLKEHKKNLAARLAFSDRLYVQQ
jgi:glycosyltransferase involved in cell wall biosynthesis